MPCLRGPENEKERAILSESPLFAVISPGRPGRCGGLGVAQHLLDHLDGLGGINGLGQHRHVLGENGAGGGPTPLITITGISAREGSWRSFT